MAHPETNGDYGDRASIDYDVELCEDAGKFLAIFSLTDLIQANMILFVVVISQIFRLVFAFFVKRSRFKSKSLE